MIVEVIELLNTARKSLSNNQAALGGQNSVFEETVSVIMSLAFDLSETIKVYFQ